VTLPNFLIIGAAKAGTTSLYEHFRAHPEIFMPRLKEPRYFCYGGSSADRMKFPIQSREEYETLFETAATETALGEASVHYLTHPIAAQRIHDAIPAARLIASLRNPVDRSYSVYQMNLRNKAANSDLPYAQALRDDPNLQDGYHEHLGRFFALFPREQLRIILLEDLEAAPRQTIGGLFDFLGVDPGFMPDLSKVANPGGAPRIKALHSLLSNGRLIAASRRFVPEPLIAPLKALRNRNLSKRPLPAADRKLATDFFREDVLRTQDLIGRDLSHWLDA
jgi:hypothetical protein